MTSSGIELATFQLEGQRLNQLRHRVPQSVSKMQENEETAYLCKTDSIKN
jgi:hypothetical protein